MRKIALSITLATLILVAMFGLIRIAVGQTLNDPTSPQVIQSESQGENTRETYAPEGATLDPDAPLISFIDSPTATCYQPDSSKDECFLNWYYQYVTADPNYMISMTLMINSIGMVANYQGFFQTSMYVPFSMHDRGFKVQCGALGSSGNPYLGKAYAWTIRARDSTGLKSANYGNTYCPAYIP